MGDDVVPGSRGRRRVLITVLLLVIPLAQFPIDVFTPAIPTMVRELATSNTLVQNAVSAYMLGMSVALVPLGVWADARGRRPVLLSSLVLLAAASAAIAFVPTIELLLALRFVQGVGGAACMVVVYAVAADIARGRELTALSGWLGASWGLAPVIAPAVGGLLVQFISWRGIFVLIAGCAVVAFVLVATALPETLRPASAVPVRPRAIGAVLARTLRDPLYLGLTFVFAVFASAQLMFGVVSPLVYEVSLGVAPAVYGLFALLIGAANLAGELATGSLATRLSPRVLGFAAFGFFAAGTAVLVVSGLTIGADIVALTVGGMLVMLGCGVLCPLAYGLALGLFERNLGLIGGLTSAVCYLVVSLTMSSAAGLPDDTQLPLGLVYVGCAVVGVVLLALVLRRGARLAH